MSKIKHITHKSVDHIVALMMAKQCINLKERLEESRRKISDLEIEVETAHAMLHIDDEFDASGNLIRIDFVHHE